MISQKQTVEYPGKILRSQGQIGFGAERNGIGGAHAMSESEEKQSILLRCLKAVVQCVEKPLAAIEIDGKSGALKWVCATPAAEELFTLSGASGMDGNSVRIFLERCRKLSEAGTGIVVWTAPGGTAYRLVRKAIEGVPPGAFIVEFLCVNGMPTGRAQLEILATGKGLTPREAKVFAGMACGLGNKEIARELDTSVHTVRAHLRNIYKTLNVSNRVEAVIAVRPIQ